MYDRRFFASELGQAALVSIVAMVAFVILAGILPGAASAEAALAGASLVELA